MCFFSSSQRRGAEHCHRKRNLIRQRGRIDRKLSREVKLLLVEFSQILSNRVSE